MSTKKAKHEGAGVDRGRRRARCILKPILLWCQQPISRSMYSQQLPISPKLSYP